MTRIAGSDPSALERGLENWLQTWEPASEVGAHVVAVTRPRSGWSSETLVVTVQPEIELEPERCGEGRAHSEIVARVAPRPEVASFPLVDFEVQADVMRALRFAGIEAPRVLAVEPDTRWLGAPFLVMARMKGRSIGDAPALDDWFMGLSPQAQRRVHDAFLESLVDLHRLDWLTAGLDGVLRDSGEHMSQETSWWRAYVEWASEGSPTRSLVELLSWCSQSAPCSSSQRSLCWGDARLGNVMLLDDGSQSGLLDWELASIGPAEMDLAWYLALDELTRKVVGRAVPGSLSRQETIEAYERRLGRPVENLEWHEVFALVRSVAINERQARLAASAGVDYPGFAGDDNPLLAYIGRRIERLEGRR